MQSTKQVSIFLDNKPGRLAQVLRALERQKVNVTGMTVTDSHEHRILRLVPDDLVRTLIVLKELDTPHAETDVLLAELRNQPGALAHVCEQLAAEHINIDYCYCSASGRNGKTFGIFKVSNMDKAVRVISGSNNSRKRKAEKRPLRDRRSYSSLQ